MRKEWMRKEGRCERRDRKEGRRYDCPVRKEGRRYDCPCRNRDLTDLRPPISLT